MKGIKPPTFYITMCGSSRDTSLRKPDTLCAGFFFESTHTILHSNGNVSNCRSAGVGGSVPHLIRRLTDK